MTSTNSEIAAVFAEIADLLAIEGANFFRTNAYRNAADTIRGMEAAVAEMSEGELEELDGIGPAIIKKIREIAETGKCEALEKQREETGGGLIEVLRLPGLGAKRVRELRDKLGVKNLADLTAACEAKQIRELPGFGEKTEERIRASLEKRSQ